MSIQSEITRISNNVQNTIDVIEQTGVSVPAGANSDTLPSLAQSLANEKQDKLTGTQGQVVGFDEDGNAVPQAAGVTSFNGRTGSVTPQSGDYTAEQVGAIPQVNGAAGQFLGFTAENVVGAVDAPSSGGEASQKDFIILSGWTSSDYTLSDPFFEVSGYAYIVGPSAANQNNIDLYENLGISAYDISVNGELNLSCQGPPPAQLALTVIKIKTGYQTSKSYCINHFWVDVDGLKKSLTPISNVLVYSQTSLPNGRMAGDVNGDGQITSADATLALKASIGSVTLTPIQVQCADIDSSGSITAGDVSIISSMADGSSLIGQYSRDVLGNWSVNPNYATEEAQFYIDVSVPGLTSSSNIALAVQGEGADQITQVVAMSGAFRVYVKLLPINPVPYKLIQ